MIRPLTSPRAARRRPFQDGRTAGFTLIETLFVAVIIGVVMAGVVMIMPGAMLVAKADGGLEQVAAALSTAKELAVSQRRNIRVEFNEPNEIVVSRIEIPGPAVTPLLTTVLEDGMTFRVYDAVPDTPDVFGKASFADFGTATSISFTSEGSFVDEGGDPVNGTVFIGQREDPLSARALTVFGPTALLRRWRWNGAGWTH